MTVLVDEAVWPWRGRRWAHLVSDESLDELHAFAAALGVDGRLFDGDHYDIPSELRGAAVGLGAEPVSSRELVRRLRASGLRLTAEQRSQLPRKVAARRPVEVEVEAVGDVDAGPVQEGPQHG